MESSVWGVTVANRIVTPNSLAAPMTKHNTNSTAAMRGHSQGRGAYQSKTTPPQAQATSPPRDWVSSKHHIIIAQNKTASSQPPSRQARHGCRMGAYNVMARKIISH